MSEPETKKTPTYELGTGVWVNLLNSIWWPGMVVEHLMIPQEFSNDVKNVDYIAVIKFESDGKYEIVYKSDQILPYLCDRKMEFVEEGFKIYKHQKMGLPVVDEFDMDDFKKDVISMELLIGGDICIFEKFEAKQQSIRSIVENFFAESKKKESETSSAEHK